jgi:hypothetical protein
MKVTKEQPEKLEENQGVVVPWRRKGMPIQNASEGSKIRTLIWICPSRLPGRCYSG